MCYRQTSPGRSGRADTHPSRPPRPRSRHRDSIEKWVSGIDPLAAKAAGLQHRAAKPQPSLLIIINVSRQCGWTPVLYGPVGSRLITDMGSDASLDTRSRYHAVETVNTCDTARNRDRCRRGAGDGSSPYVHKWSEVQRTGTRGKIAADLTSSFAVHLDSRPRNSPWEVFHDAIEPARWRIGGRALIRPTPEPVSQGLYDLPGSIELHQIQRLIFSADSHHRQGP